MEELTLVYSLHQMEGKVVWDLLPYLEEEPGLELEGVVFYNKQ